MRWVQMTEGGRAREGQELWSTDNVYLGRWFYNPNVCSYQWEVAGSLGIDVSVIERAHSREEAKEKLTKYLVNRRLEKV